MAEILVSYEPATGAELWSGEVGDAASEVSAARTALADWSGRSVSYRMEALRRFANEVRGRADAFADLIARETGKPLWEAKTEVASVIGKVDISIEAYAERTPMRRSEGAMGSKVTIRHKPHGVLAVLGPYNFPAHLPNGHIVPALLAGNTVVFKPSEKTPASGAMLVDCFHAAGIPEGAVRLLTGGIEQGKALAADPGIDGLLFTGSAGAGAALARQFAEVPHKILALELGGNNPIVVWGATDLAATAAMVVQSAFLSAGQRCTCARRLIVEDGQHQPLVDEIVKLIDRIIVDHPHADPQPFIGPVIDQMTAEILVDRFVGLMMKGGHPIRRLVMPYDDRPYLTPALIDMTEAKDRLDEELFGPILQMVRVPDFDAAIAEANNSRFGLAASIVTRQPALYERFFAEVRAGVINWNRPTNGAPSSAPFGGVGRSGNHRPSAFYAADYCAYPVTSVESDVARASIAEGLRDAYVPEDDRV
ncbi:succinylglutamate-semialdehyde dehydrogenase [Sphingomonas sp. ASV193]|uniref:succinylglutamate-semialdehyde dehydrogenase n=1 Tax=Sphingomonas sp. ASV193 TaxID=3144405 RepID=UPI0032E889AE